MNKHVTFVILLICLSVGCGSSGSGGMGGFERVAELPAVYQLGEVWSFGPSDVWVTADSGQLLHYDGSGWEVIQLETTEWMLAIWGFSPTDVWVVGGQTLARYDGTSWEVTDLSTLEPGIEGLADIWGSAPDDVWVVGSQSTAAHFDGVSWQRYLAAGPDNTVVWGSGPNDVYTASVFDVARWDGTDWTTIDTSGYSMGAESIFGFGPDDVWVSDGDELSHFNGTDWELTQLDYTAEAAALWGLAPDDLWGVGTPGGILHYDGTAWREVAHQRIGAPYLRSFHDVHGSAYGDVWIVGVEMGVDGVVPQLWRRLP